MFGRESRAEKRQAKLAAEVYDRRDEMLQEFRSLAELNVNPEDLLMCLGCCELVVRGHEGKHIAQHAWEHSTNPVRYLDPYWFQRAKVRDQA